MYASLSKGNQVEKKDYHMDKNLLFHLGKLCISQGERLSVMREAHSFLIAGHFGVSKTMAHLHRYYYWPHMIDSVSNFIRGCSTSPWTLLEVNLCQESNTIIFM